MHKLTSRTTLLALAAVALTSPTAAHAASSKGCDGGAFSVVAPGKTVAGSSVSTTIPASALTGPVLIKGKYQDWTVDPDTLAVRDFTFTGAANPLSMTGGKRIVAFASKTPDLRGAQLTGPLEVSLDKEAITLHRSGAGVGMGIQAKDCANGGIFQMEPERADGTATTFTHVLGAGSFYYDNPFFRARIGEVLNGVTVSARVNLGNDLAPRFVGRDSPQVATRVSQSGTTSVWSVASGGRMGQVMGEDATEVAPAATTCTHQCQAQNKGGADGNVNLGFPSPVPAASRL